MYAQSDESRGMQYEQIQGDSELHGNLSANDSKDTQFT